MVTNDSNSSKTGSTSAASSAAVPQIAIVGTNGIPAKYGGFETLAERLVLQLSHRFDFTVYCSSLLYKNKPSTHESGARLIYLPVSANGRSSIVYDVLSLLHALRYADRILLLGVSGCMFLPLFRPFCKARLIVNVDGIESRREKWKWWASKFLRASEAMAVKFAEVVIADNAAIQEYLMEQYAVTSKLIAYGGDNALSPNNAVIPELWKRQLEDQLYGFTVCRIEPENNIDLIIKGFAGQNKFKLVIVGNWEGSNYGRKLKSRYAGNESLLLLDPIYNLENLNGLRGNCSIYVHGHSAGGTNPSLVEAMTLELPVVAFDVIFNRNTMGNMGCYFSNASELTELLKSLTVTETTRIGQDLGELAREKYTWSDIGGQYADVLE